MSKSFPARRALTALAAIAILASTHPAPAANGAALYRIENSIPLGGPERWDYLAFEPASHRVYVAHGNKIEVLDAVSNTIVGQVPVDGANGVAVALPVGKGYAGSRAGKSVVVFDLITFKVVKTLPGAEDSDAVVYDPVSQHIFVMNGDPHSMTVIDTSSDRVVSTIHLRGQPEFAVVDGMGKLFVNIEDRREIQRVDTKTGMVDATWPIAACDSPHGLAIDNQAHRLFATCVNSKLLVVNAATGAVVSTLAIGKRSDAAAFDGHLKRVFSSNGEGTLSVIQQGDSDRYKSLGNLPTQVGARTMTLDAESGRLYLVTGDYSEVDPSAKDPRKRYAVSPGSTRVLLVDPVP